MRNMRFSFFVSFIVGFVSMSQAQNYAHEYAEMAASLSKHDFVSIGVKISFYSENTAKPDMLYNGEIVVNGKKSYSRLNSSEVLNDSKFSVTVDHTEKLISVANSNSSNPLFFVNPQMLDSVLKKVKSQIKYSTENGMSKYTFLTSDDGPFKSIQVWFDKNTHFLKKMKMEVLAEEDPYEENGKLTAINPFVVVDFQKYDYRQRESSLFDVSKYVVIDTKGAKLKPGFASYTLLNPNRIN